MRVKYIDAAKAVGIILMIIGHSICTMHEYTHVAGFIYSFHMPLFFIISGYFVKDNFQFNPWEKYGKAYLRPYVATAIVLLAAVVVAVLMDYIPKSDIVNYLVATIFVSGGVDDYAKFGNVYAIGPLWFLFSLFWSQIFYFYIRRYTSGLDRLSFILGLFAFGWLSSQYIRLPLSIQSGMCAVLFLEIGYRVHKYDIIDRTKSLSIFSALPLLLVYLIGWSKGQVTMSIAHYELPLFSITGSVIASVALLALLKKVNIRGGYYWREHTLYLVWK